MSSRLSLVGAALLATTGCNTAYRNIGSPDPGFGEAVKWNMATQVIDPDPVYGELASEPGSSGVKASEATKRYRTDKVKPVERIRTSESTTGSGGAGGSGGGGPQ